MSTKTSLLKRIAQTAVVALVTGLLSFVTVPASNAAPDPAISGTCVARAGVGGILNITATGSVGRTTGANAIAVRIRAKEIARTAVAGAADGTTTLQTGLIISGNTETGTSGLVLPVLGESITAGLASITYSVWTDNAQNSDDTSAPGADSASTTITCTVAGAPTSFSLSSTTGSLASGETATLVITPKDANGVTTLLVESVTAANPNVETFTITANSATANTVTMISGKGPGGIASTSLRSGAGIRPLVNPSTLRSLFASGDEASGLSKDTQTVRIKYARDTGTARMVNSANTSIVSGTLASSGTTNRLALDSRFADTATTGAIQSEVGGETLTVGLNQFGGETLTATGAFTVRLSVDGAGTTTFTVAGGSGMSGVTAATYTLTTQSFGYVDGISFGSAVAALSTSTTGYAGLGIYQATNVERTLAAGDLTARSVGQAATTKSYSLSTATGKTISLKLHNTGAASTIPVTVAAVTGSTLPAGITAGTTNYTTVARTDGTETSTTITLTATAPLPGDAYSVAFKINATTTRTLTFTYAAPIVSSAVQTLTMAPGAGTTYKNVTGGTNTLEATVTDQFADAFSGATVRAVITGRNAQTLTYTTDALGKATVTWKDAGAVLTGSGVTGTTDDVSVTAQSASAAAATTAIAYTITYSATLTATTLTLTNGSAAAGTAADGAVVFTATVLDASGVALSGYPVVFTGSTGTFFSSVANTTTAYTNTAGVATATFRGKTIGTGTITATSGGKSATSSFTILAGTARNISIDAATLALTPGTSKRVTVTVKDSYGNADEGEVLTVTYVGTAGRVASVNGVTAATGTTDASGKVVIELISDAAGTGTLTVSFTGGSTATTTNLDGTARLARVASVTSAVTISGNSAAVDAANAASDAAAEAIDAANAATDAANLAAEAADAATVAAEEARDAADAATAAVEELAQQVATLMAALKAQITTLANTVAKIAKKVKA